MRRALVSLVFVWGIFVFSTVFPAQASTRLSVPEVIEISTPAVVSIRVYDERDSLIGQGTGFFVSSKGELVTNFRALRRAHRVLVKTSSGETLTVRGMIAQNQKYELIKLLVRVRVPNSWLPLADRLPEKGQRIVIINSPNGVVDNTPTGWVSAVRDVPRFGSLVQITVPDSTLDSGSPILDDEGQVVGVVAILHEAQNVHIAVPAFRVGEMEDADYLIPLSVWVSGSPSVVGSISLSVAEVGVVQDNSYPKILQEPHELLAEGVEAYFLGRYEESALALREALKLKPKNPDAHYTLGMAYEALGLWKEALREYQETVRLEPTYAMAYNAMGIAYGEMDRWDEAVGSFKQAIRLTPTYAEAHANLGSAYRRLRRWPEAADAYEKAIRLQADYVEAHFYLGLVYEKLGKPGDAMYAFEEAVKFKPDYAPAHSSLGVVYVRLGHLEKGMDALKKALRLEPSNAEALNYLGVVYGQLGRYDDEVKTLETAVRYEPFFWEAHSNLGVAYWRGGRAQEALVEFKRTLRLKPDDSTAHFYLGLIYLSLGNQGGAMHEYRVLSKLDRVKANKLFLLIGGKPHLPTS